MSYTESFRAGLKPDPHVSITEYSDTYVILAKESSKEAGRYRSSRTPYVIEPMNELSPSSPTQKVVMVKPTQSGGSQVATNFLFSIVDMFPGPCMMGFPTDSLARKHSKKNFTPSLKLMPTLKGKIKPVKSRDSGNTILEKDFPGGSIVFTGSNSPVSARHDSIRFLILDDFDGFEQDVGGEGSPGELFAKRTDSYGKKKKIYINSTPTIKDFSNIEKEYNSSSMGLFNVPCPQCKKLQYLEWGGKDHKYGIKFIRDEDNQILDVWYMCRHCGKRIEESSKEWMMSQGLYVHKYPNRKVRGFKYNSLYSPLGWVSWEQIAEEFVDIKGNREKLKVFVNTRLAETFEEAGDQPDWVVIKNRAEPYPFLTIPEGGLFLTMGTDTHDNRLTVIVRAWGKYEESWLVYYGELWGDPDQPGVWKQHDEILNMEFKGIADSRFHIISCAIDTGGHRTQAVYNYCRMRSPRVIAIKGASQHGKPVVGRPTLQDVTWKGEVIKNGVSLWPLGVDTIKSIVYSRLNQTETTIAKYHFPIGLDDSYYMQLTAQKLITRFVKGFPTSEWVNVRKEDHVLDTENYCYGAAIRAGMALMNWDKEKKPKKKKHKKNKQVAKSKWMG